MSAVADRVASSGNQSSSQRRHRCTWTRRSSIRQSPLLALYSSRCSWRKRKKRCLTIQHHVAWKCIQCHTSSLFLQRAADSTRVLPLEEQRLLLAANLTTSLSISGPASYQNDLFSLESRSPGFERLCPGFSLFKSESIDWNPAVTGVDALYIVR